MALAFFGDVEAPVYCALQISEALHNGSGIKLRMGIHSGPIYRVEDINTNRNVAGGGINIAQRVMDCGDAGHILLSKAAAENLLQVRAWADALQDFGEAEVKHGVRVHVYNLCMECMGNAELPQKLQAARQAAAPAKPKSKAKRVSAALFSAAILIAVAGVFFFQSHRAHALTSKDTIVLADFVNKTGDPVFDDTLKEGLAVELQQSPFLSLISEQKVGQTLKLMGR